MQNIDPAATAFVLISAALVFIMTPGLAFFYGGVGAPKECAFDHDAKLYLNGYRYGHLGLWWIQPGFRQGYWRDHWRFALFCSEWCWFRSIDRTGYPGTGFLYLPGDVCHHYPGFDHWCVCRPGKL